MSDDTKAKNIEAALNEAMSAILNGPVPDLVWLEGAWYEAGSPEVIKALEESKKRRGASND